MQNKIPRKEKNNDTSNSSILKIYHPVKSNPENHFQFCFIRAHEKPEKTIHKPMKSRIEKIEIEKEFKFE
jgi:hypothetical protein